MARVKKGSSAKKKSKAIQFQMGWGGLTALVVSTFCVLLWTFIMGFWVGQKLVGRGSVSEKNLSTLNTLDEPLPDAPKINIPERPVEPAFPPVASMQENTKPEEPVSTALPETGSSASAESGVSAHQPAALPKESVGSVAKVTETPITESAVAGAGAETVKQKATVKAESVKPKKAASKPVKTAKKETVKEKPLSKTFFVLQIASYRDRNRAEKEAARWRKKGITAQVSRVSLKKKGIWYRVYLGHYSTVEDAQAGARRLARKEGVRSYVVPIKS